MRVTLYDWAQHAAALYGINRIDHPVFSQPVQGSVGHMVKLILPLFALHSCLKPMTSQIEDCLYVDLAHFPQLASSFTSIQF